MASDPLPQPSEVVLGLDDARDFFFCAARACERFSQELTKVVESLNAKKADDAWLEELSDECTKSISFHEQQGNSWHMFSDTLTSYIAAVRAAAEDLAIKELKGINDEEGKAKYVHPELVKFKLEKQARILGKLGGAPALGAGMVLPRMQRDSVLRATGTAAAREIHYSKTENKDARDLAEVMRFKQTKKDEKPTEWQEEVQARHLRTTKDEPDTSSKPALQAAVPYGAELLGTLTKRQEQLDAREAAEAAVAKLTVHRDPMAAASDELAQKLTRRQAQQAEQAAAPAEDAPLPSTWTNAAAPFGSELVAAMAQRQERAAKAAADAAAAARAAPLPPRIGAADNELAARLRARQAQVEGNS